MRLLFILIIFCCGFSYPNVSNLKDTIDSQKIKAVLRLPQPGYLDSLRNDKDFDYLFEKYQPNIIERIYAKIMEWLWNIFGRGISALFDTSAKYLVLALAVLIAVYILRRLKLTPVLYSADVFSENSKAKLELDSSVTELEDELSAAIMNKDSRKALRLHYILLIKALAEKGLIKPDINKTNYQYVQELSRQEIKKSFSELTWFFENIWYGGKNADDTAYEGIFNKFNILRKEVLQS